MFFLVKVDARAANIIEWKIARSNTGYDDYDITWTMYDDGTLEINGTGYLYLHGYSKYSSKVKNEKIGGGITQIQRAFTYPQKE